MTSLRLANARRSRGRREASIYCEGQGAEGQAARLNGLSLADLRFLNRRFA